MTALAWNEFFPAAEAHSFWQADLGPFTLYTCADAWRVLLTNCEVAHGPADHVDAAKRAAEAWLRAHLHDLLHQLRDPDDNAGSDPLPARSLVVVDDKRERRAPVQSSSRKGGKGPGTISWQEHLEAWRVYQVQYSGQDAEEIARRQGFSFDELVMFLGHEPKTWRPLR